MRRKPGHLTPLELSVIAAIMSLGPRESGVYGFLIAKEMRALAGSRYRTAHGTLYKTLERLEGAGLLKSAWEDPNLALQEGRPRRRLYELTADGLAAYELATRPVEKVTGRAAAHGGAA
jgi:DNA-binding PadR family transcriptional regulator